MRIISKIKEYYDYIVGQWGIDNDVIFDRRDYKYSSNTVFQKYNEDDIKHYSIRNYTYKNQILFVVEIGYVQYLFLNSKRGIEFIKKLESTYQIFDLQRKYYTGERLYEYYENKLWKDTVIHALNNETATKLYLADSWCLMKFSNNLADISIYDLAHNSILKEDGLLISKEIIPFIPAEEAYNNIYNFLISKKDKQYQDNMTDIEKLQSKGFDKITSFRKM